MNYATYFSRGQKIFLINITPGRDDSIFDAFSSTIVSCNNRQFELHPRYNLHHGDEGILSEGMLFKVTAESFGSGVQFVGKVTSVHSGSFILEPTDQMEMYQRGQVPRTDIVTGFRSFTKTAPLAFFRHEWRRFIDSIASGRTEKFDLPEIQLNLSAGGLRYVVDRSDHQTDLAMIFLDLQDGNPPICAVAEQLWRRSLPEEEGVAIGRRFVLIKKTDQIRIQSLIDLKLKKNQKKPVPERNNWELLDRMIYNKS